MWQFSAALLRMDFIESRAALGLSLRIHRTEFNSSWSSAVLEGTLLVSEFEILQELLLDSSNDILVGLWIRRGHRQRPSASVAAL